RILLEDREVRVEADASLPEIMADGELVGLTIRQLLTNALKYANPESPIIIKVRGIDDAVQTSVKDLGPGIAPKNLQRIFEKYYRVEDNTGRIRITVMGLSIFLDTDQANCGSIGVENET